MTKCTIFAVFIILILGMMVKEMEGKPITYCKTEMAEVDCATSNCNDACKQKYNDGTGQCMSKMETLKFRRRRKSKKKATMTCFCSHPCIF
ncbi:hypothetical protein ARALYDRAFT_917480 [Arabidopsis lyrata subsp. lyrata]|uniref:Uncharacterized protein n=1 Tax=Arabidopsis lyrata subsp. lyrata TaxID=81972 RepID=D7MS17_ARALL|nr:hypothetical protein ARALYDRAFT_917480 [Arabidopsis lyrata subsp. lyrata]